MSATLPYLQKLIFYSIILFLPTQLGKHFWPTWSYVSGIRVDYLSPTLYFTDLLIIALFISCFLSIFLTRESKFSIFNFQFSIKHKKFKNLNIKNSLKIKNLKLKIILSISFLLLGIFLSKNPMAGMYGLAKLFEFIFFGWYTSRFIKEKKDFGLVILILSFGVCFESLLAIAQYINQSSIGGIFYFFGERTFTSQTPGIANASLDGKLTLRPYGTFPHPNVLAGYLVIAMTMIIFNLKFEIFNQFTKLKKLIFICPILIGSVALLLTMSRVTIVLWIMTVSIFVFKNLNIKNSLKIIFVGLMCVIGSIIISPLSPRFFTIEPTDESITRRIELVKTAAAIIQQHPFFGVGLNNFLPNLSSFQNTANQSMFSYLQPVHNVFFLVASETGIVGLSFFVCFLIKTWQKLKAQSSKLKTTAQNLKTKNFFIHYSLFIILILGLFDHYFLTLQQGQLLLAFVFGICWLKNKLSV